MTKRAEFQCRCGNVSGYVADPSPSDATRVVCHCDDCQAFAHQLGRADILDEHGGTDIVQVAPASVTIERGRELVACLRLSPKGLHRFYTTCCSTPLANCLSAQVPFVGLFASSVAAPDHAFGASAAPILGRFAIGTPPEGSTSLNFGVIAWALWKILGWRVGGRAWPHPFFDRATGEASTPVTILTSEQREALRPLCGPR